MRMTGRILLALLLLAVPCHAYWIWTPETGRWINPKYAVKPTPEEQLAYADSFRERGERDDAIREYRKLLKHYPKTASAARALWNLAGIYEELGDDDAAFDFLQAIVDDHPESPLVADAIRKQHAIAERMMSSQKRSFLPRILRDSGERERKLEKVITNDPYSTEAAARAVKLAEYYLSRKKYGEAENLLRDTLSQSPDDPQEPAARALLIRVHTCAIPDVSTDVSAYQKVVAEADTFLARFPSVPQADAVREIRQKAREGAARALTRVAEFYERTRGRNAALPYWRRLAAEYPDTPQGADAAGKIAPQ